MNFTSLLGSEEKKSGYHFILLPFHDATVPFKSTEGLKCG